MPTKTKTKRKQTDVQSISISVKNDVDVMDKPIVVSFPSGIPEGLVVEGGDGRGKEGDNDAMKPQFVWKKMRESKSSSGGGRSLMGTDDTCIFQSQSALRATDDDRLTKLCVGIYDKQTGQVVVHEAAAGGNVFAMHQSVKSYQDTSNEQNTTRLSALEQRDLLFASFGSYKKQKVLRSQKANLIDVNMVVGAGDAMQDAFKHQKLSESNKKAIEEAKHGNKVDAVESAHEEARRRFLPPFNADAEEPHLVYDARDIGNDITWAQVTRVVDACMKKDDMDFTTSLLSRGRWSDSVKGLVEMIPKQAPHAKHQLKCAVLLNHLIKFHNEIARKDFVRGPDQEVAKFFRLSTEVCSAFLENFTTSMTNKGGIEGFKASKQNKDKCLVHVLLLYMMAHGRSMSVGNIRPVADDVKLELKDAGNLLRAAGCTVTTKKISSGTAMSSALNVPLKFPNAKRGGRAP
mmetsp:Transcript_30623/g.46990  ORF Transcript_30623/g.46990 Transcript_30623/m.46990 type:complete len:460 (-) Transcript_30623:58-1437(-)